MRPGPTPSGYGLRITHYGFAAPARVLRMLAVTLCLLALGLPAAAAEDEPPATEAPEQPKAKGKEPLRIRPHKAGHIVGIRTKGEVAVNDAFAVRRGSRLVAYATVAELVEHWPRLAYLIGAGRPDDELFPLAAPVPKVQLLTDELGAPETKELKALLADRLVVEELGDQVKIHSDCTVRIIIIHGGIFFMGADPVAGPFARQGGTVILDTLAYSHIKGEIADETKFKEPTTLRILREEGITAGFPPESRIPWFGARKPKEFVARYIKGFPADDSGEKLLATDHSGKNSALLEVDWGGRVAVMDLVTPTGRAGRDHGAKNKLIFLSRALGAGPRYARYMPSKPEYEDLLKWFDDLADNHKDRVAKAFEGGGEKREDFIYSYTIGPKEPTRPLVVLAAALRGTAWLGAAALNRLAEVLLENPHGDPEIPWLLERLRIKLIPVANPHGYRANVDANENGVELDRNFAYQWDAFADKAARGKKPFSEAGAAVIQRCIEKDKAVAYLDIAVDDYDAGYRIVRARDLAEPHHTLLANVIPVVNARLKYRFVVGDKMLQLRLTRDAPRPSAANWAGATGALAASLRICGDGEDSITNTDVAVETCLHFLYAVALSREKPEPEPPEPPKKQPRPPPRPEAPAAPAAK